MTDRLKAKLNEARRRRPFLDHLLATQEHYSAVKGNLQAGAVTYYAFLSFFPILALAFFAVGWISRVFPQVQSAMVKAIEEVLPGIVGEGEGEISLLTIQDAAGAVGLIGLVGVLYAGLGWLSGMREALLVMFDEPSAEQPNFVIGKLRDLASLVLIGVVMVVSVGVSAVLSRSSRWVLRELGLAEGLSPLLWVLSVVVGMAAATVLFYALFQLLARPNVPRNSLWSGALLGAIAFELLKQVSTLLIASTKSQPAFQAFGIALILVVWMNYFSRVVMYAAAWAWSSPAAAAVRAAQPPEALPAGPHVGPALAARPASEQSWPPSAVLGAGAVLGLGLARLLRRRS
ncbi:YihY/virulence factor BrkB family protein [Nocardioides sp. Bht2]|uniref:YihY/virulence factor BrkB family protein n=1 Tax=Nocardioides sp. Bht2 TaxID=3392297 RepID=UPI0039B38F12